MFWIRIYDFFTSHRKGLWISFAALTLLLAGLVTTVRFSENISDFLPLGSKEREALDVYQKISGADRIVCLFSSPGDADLTVEAVDAFASRVAEMDAEGWCGALVASYDAGQIRRVMEFAYDNIPFFLEDEDYLRMDSLLAQPGYIEERMRQNRTALMFPSGDMAGTVIARDPLGLFSPVVETLSDGAGHDAFVMYDGHIFTPDMSRAIVTLASPLGSSETSGNSRLVALLEDAASTVEADYPGVEVRLTGGPVIAVGNSSRIKKDTAIAVALSAVLILILLIMSFSSVLNIALILLSIGWGWLFAMGGMALSGSGVSVIVIGISSVILGIAVNYPLHLVAHIAHKNDVREAMKEITAPLVIGNITTVGAFLALVPLHSVALRDFGIFASLLLAGTIAFVLVFLPHMVRKGDAQKPARGRLIPAIAGFHPENSRVIVVAVLILTAVFAFLGTRTSFDSDLADINYMTPEQRADMEYFALLASSNAERDTRELFVLSKGEDFDDALASDLRLQHTVDSLTAAGLISSFRSASHFLCPLAEQERRLERWKAFAARFRSVYEAEFARAGRDAGFSAAAFSRFEALVSEEYSARPRGMDGFDILSSGPFVSNVAAIGDGRYVVKSLRVREENVSRVKECIDDCFDISELDDALSDSLSSNFNYIGWACSLIVFLFLWLSFGSLEMALISFLPMAVSWIWILGLMSLLGIQFNIVNIILATFIFGQGDDYTIFMAEGCQYEYAHGKPVMGSYKRSIIQSALIMFAGIGTLIVARHPAMKSLAEVTIIGMFSVVFMAYLIPPFLFRFLTTSGGKVRAYPLTLRRLFFGVPDSPAARVMGRYIYKGRGICREVKRNLEKASVNVDSPGDTLEIRDCGYGETAILAACNHPDMHIRALMTDDERMEVAVLSAKDFVHNIEFVKIGE